MSSLAQSETVNLFLKSYAGAYRMVANGQAVTSDTDRYFLSPDGKCTWTIFLTTTKTDGSVSRVTETKPGKWTASEGLIQIFIDGVGEGELLTDFRLEDGVFKAEGVNMKKEVIRKKK